MDLLQQIFAVTGIAATALLIIQVLLMLFGLAGGGSDASGSPDGTFVSDVHLPGSDIPTGDINIDMPPVSDISVGGIEIDMPPGDMTVGDVNIDVPSGADINIDINGDAVQAAHAASGVHLFTLQGFVAFFAVFGWAGLALLKATIPSPAAIAVAVGLGISAMYILALIYKVMLKLQQDGSADIKYALGKTASVYIPIPPKRENAGKVTVMVGDRLTELDAVTDGEKEIPTGREVTVIGVSNNMTLIVRPK